MFCPRCKTTYGEGVLTCPDCQVELIAEPKPGEEPEYVEYEEVLSTYSHGDIVMLKSLLDAENVTYYVLGERFGDLYRQPAKLMVSTDDAAMVREIIKEMDLRYLGVSIPNEEALNEMAAAASDENEHASMNGPAAKDSRLTGLLCFVAGVLVGALIAGSFQIYDAVLAIHSTGTVKRDNNRDGKTDEWLTYKYGALEAALLDQNFDGRIDGIWKLEGGVTVSGQQDVDFNGVFDTTEHYRNGVIESAEFCPNNSKVVVKKQTYKHGVLTEAFVDEDRDGKFDVRIIYDLQEEPVKRIPIR